MTEYYIPTGHSQTELVEKRSRFIGQVWQVTSEEEARARIEETRKQHYDARHNCWCFRVREGGAERYSDDGEPQGTAGQPMLGVFQKEGVVNVCCVATRYFGGILLGAGGLARAYARSAKDALDAAGVSAVRRWVVMEVPCAYAQLEEVRREVLRFGGVEERVDYGADVLLCVLIPEERSSQFAAHVLDASAGAIEAQEAGEAFRAAPMER